MSCVSVSEFSDGADEEVTQDDGCDDVDASLQSPLSRHLKPVRSHVVRAAPTLGLPLTAQTQH